MNTSEWLAVNRLSREAMLMEFAFTAAKRGTCQRLFVGAIIAREARVISTGYVGAVSGAPHCWEMKPPCDLKQPCTRTRHAERNAIDFAEHYGIDIGRCDIFLTDSPCIDCATRIAEAGIERVYYARTYRIPAGLQKLASYGVTTIHYPIQTS